MRAVKNVFTFVLLLFISSCGNKKSNRIDSYPSPVNTKLISEYKLAVPEPSGLTLISNNEFLLTVSDETSKIYKMNLTGEVIDSFQVDGIDLEGITTCYENEYFVITERDRGLTKLDSNFSFIDKTFLPLEGESNLGLEGVAFDAESQHIFIVNEKNPTSLLELDAHNKIVNEIEIDFAKDLSGLFYNSTDGSLWILSDESRALFKCTKEGKVLAEYPIDIQQMEGVALDVENKLIYIVSDFTGKLYVFEYE